MVTSRNNRGYTFSGNIRINDQFLGGKRNIEGKTGMDKEGNDHTSVSFIPLSSAERNTMGINTGGDVLVAVRMYGQLEQRTGVYYTAFALPKSTADALKETLRTNPVFIFSIVRRLNGGAFIRSDTDKPGTFEIGTNIHLLTIPETLDGILSRQVTSPFPPGFNPNPEITAYETTNERNLYPTTRGIVMGEGRTYRTRGTRNRYTLETHPERNESPVIIGSSRHRPIRKDARSYTAAWRYRVVL